MNVSAKNVCKRVEHIVVLEWGDYFPRSRKTDGIHGVSVLKRN